MYTRYIPEFQKGRITTIRKHIKEKATANITEPFYGYH